MGRRQAISSCPTLSAEIWSRAEYLVLPRSAPKLRHSPFTAPCWANAAAVATTNTVTVINNVARGRISRASFGNRSTVMLRCDL